MEPFTGLMVKRKDVFNFTLRTFKSVSDVYFGQVIWTWYGKTHHYGLHIVSALFYPISVNTKRDPGGYVC